MKKTWNAIKRVVDDESFWIAYSGALAFVNAVASLMSPTRTNVGFLLAFVVLTGVWIWLYHSKRRVCMDKKRVIVRRWINS